MPVQSVSSNQFLTTTSIIDRLNAQLPAGSFELHTRLPDGSSRSATQAEQTSADFQAKLQQAVVYVESLNTEEERLAWGTEQNELGKSLFQVERRFEEAIDVYLTCLTVTGELGTLAHAEFFAKVMNNLASCTMQLKWYRKTIHFCTIALDQIHASESFANEESLKIYLAKLYFKRSKAGRLRGDYRPQDLETALSLLSGSTEELRYSVATERRLLDNAIAKANLARMSQKQALQKQFGDKSHAESDLQSEETPKLRLYEEKNPRARQFSTIRANVSSVEDSGNEPISYFKTYWERVTKQAMKLFNFKED